jgi:hypothetical protein
VFVNDFAGAVLIELEIERARGYVLEKKKPPLPTVAFLRFSELPTL